MDPDKRGQRGATGAAWPCCKRCKSSRADHINRAEQIWPENGTTWKSHAWVTKTGWLKDLNKLATLFLNLRLTSIIQSAQICIGGDGLSASHARASDIGVLEWCIRKDQIAHYAGPCQWQYSMVQKLYCHKPVPKDFKQCKKYPCLRHPKESKITATPEHKKTLVSMQPVMSWLIRRTAITTCFWTSQHYPLQPGNHLNPIWRNPDF